jgi:hypothetical protein
MTMETVHTDAAIAAGAAVRPFTVDVPEGDLVDVRNRVRATRRPEKDTVEDQTQGVQLATIQALAQAPRTWFEAAYPNLIHFNEVDRGNHFAACQEPQLFAGEVRAAFRSLR